MDPGSIAGLALAVSDALISASSALYKFTQATKKYDQTIFGLHSELDGLTLLVKSIRTTVSQPQLVSSVVRSEAPVGLWMALFQELRGCEMTGKNLTDVLSRHDIRKRGVWSKAVQQFRLGLSAEDVASFRSQVQVHTNYLQCSLSTIQLHMACQTPEQITNLCHHIVELTMKLPAAHVTSLPAVLQSNSRRVVERSARQLLSNASNIVESSEYGGSEVGETATVIAKTRDRIRDWMSDVDGAEQTNEPQQTVEDQMTSPAVINNASKASSSSNNTEGPDTSLEAITNPESNETSAHTVSLHSEAVAAKSSPSGTWQVIEQPVGYAELSSEPPERASADGLGLVNLLDSLKNWGFSQTRFRMSGTDGSDHLSHVFNIVDTRGRTTLSWAASHANIEAVQLLLSHGANPNEQDGGDSRWRPILWATWSQHGDSLAILRTLVFAGAKVNTVESSYWPGGQHERTIFMPGTPWYEATYVDFEYFARSMSYGPQYETPLYLAARLGYLEKVKYLLDAGAKPNAYGPFGSTALHVASCENHCAIVQLLLQRGADQAMWDAMGNTPVALAISQGHVDTCRIFIDSGLDTSVIVDKDRNSLVNLAMKYGMAKIVTLAIDRLQYNFTEENALEWAFYAAEHGHVECLRLLIDSGKDVRYMTWKDCFLLHWATFYKNPGIVRLLLESGCDANTLTMLRFAGVSALHIAAAYSCGDIAQTLIDYHARVDMPILKGSNPDASKADNAMTSAISSLNRNNPRFTSLMVASKHENLDVVKVLLRKKASIWECDDAGNNAFALALQGPSKGASKTATTIRSLLLKAANV